jgi:anti-anti-sigma factor
VAAQPGRVVIERHPGVDVIRLLGEHDMATARALRDALETAVAAGGGVVVSVAETEFVDSAAINALFKTDRLLRERDRRLVLHMGTAPVVRRTLELMSVHDAIPSAGEIETALALASTPRSDPSWSTG